MSGPERALMYQSAPALPPAPAVTPTADPVLLMLQLAAGMAGFTDQVRHSLAWLVMNVGKVQAPGDGDDDDARAAKTEVRAALVTEAVACLRPDAKRAPAPEPRRRSRRGGRGRRKQEAETAAS